MRLFQLAALACVLAAISGAQAHAVVFRQDNFFDPQAYLSKVEPARRTALERAFAAVVLIGGHATGVIISPDGLMMTARHTLADDWDTGPNADCSRIPLFLNHERDADGTMDARLERVRCARVLVSEYNDDFALLQLAPLPEGRTYPYAEPETDLDAIHAGMTAIVAGHPHALDYEKAVKKVSDGPIVLYRPNDEELPHFLHLIDTEPGDSGAPILSTEGKLVGIHFRGVPHYSDGVDVVVDGKTTRIQRFNVSLVVPYLMKKYVRH